MPGIRPSHSNERGGAKDASYDYGDDYYDNKTNTHHNVNKLATSHDYGDDTAPFDVASFLDYLDYRDEHDYPAELLDFSPDE